MGLRVQKLLPWLALISLINVSAVGQQKMTLTYDRIQFAEDFLNEMYPGLGPHHLITIQTVFSRIGSSYFYVGITPCHPGNGVPAGGSSFLPMSAQRRLSRPMRRLFSWLRLFFPIRSRTCAVLGQGENSQPKTRSVESGDYQTS